MEKNQMYKEVRIKKVNPIYTIGLTWLLYGMFLPLYRFTDLLIVAGLSVLVYIAARRFIPENVVIAPLTEKGGFDTHCMEIISKGYDYIEQLERSNAAIPDALLTKQIGEITDISRQMFDYASKNPRIASDLRNFIDYYYPTTLKLLDAYIEMRGQNIKGQNANDIINKVSNVLVTIVTAFRKQLDQMYHEKQLDIKTDIDVLKSVLASEGLTEATALTERQRGLH